MAFMITPRRFLKLTLLISLFIFLIINTSYFWAPFQNRDDKNAVRVVRDNPSISESATPAQPPQDGFAQVEKSVGVEKKRSDIKKKQSDANQSSQADNSESSDKRLNESLNESLTFIINDINSAQKIRNAEKFPPNDQNTYSHVFVVQVHNRDHYLQPLIHSLERVQDVNRSLLIVSHDYYSKEVFDVVESITFMPVSV